jgi:hypothetical protein
MILLKFTGVKWRWLPWRSSFEGYYLDWRWLGFQLCFYTPQAAEMIVDALNTHKRGDRYL